MRFASLGSGSRGNALVVESGSTRVLLDCGFSIRETERRLARLNLAADSLTAILVTHEHSDHVAGVFKLARRCGIPVCLTHGTLVEASPGGELPDVVLVDGHCGFAIGNLDIQPFPVPHDAREPVQYVIGDGKRRLGVLTDCGSLTAHLAEKLTACDALVLECNHDRDMLAASRYPALLKQRIAGRLGHLSNCTAATLLTRIDVSRLQHIVAAHLSAENNSVALARDALASALSCAPDWVAVADQEEGLAWRQIV